MKHEAANNSAEALGSDKEGWALVLVNDSHPLDVSYVPESMVELESERFVDARIEEPLRQMLDDGAKAGLSMYVASAYRSSEKQKEVFNATMQDWMANGRTPLEAYDETKKSVAVPGTSEHATGLAVDIIASEYEVWMTGRERRTNKMADGTLLGIWIYFKISSGKGGYHGNHL